MGGELEQRRIATSSAPGARRRRDRAASARRMSARGRVAAAIGVHPGIVDRARRHSGAGRRARGRARRPSPPPASRHWASGAAARRATWRAAPRPRSRRQQERRRHQRQPGQPRRNEIEQIVEPRRRPAEGLMARRAMADHAVGGVDHLVGEQAGQAEEQGPEQRRHHAVGEILGQRFERRRGRRRPRPGSPDRGRRCGRRRRARRRAHPRQTAGRPRRHGDRGCSARARPMIRSGLDHPAAGQGSEGSVQQPADSEADGSARTTARPRCRPAPLRARRCSRLRRRSSQSMTAADERHRMRQAAVEPDRVADPASRAAPAAASGRARHRRQTWASGSLSTSIADRCRNEQTRESETSMNEQDRRDGLRPWQPRRRGDHRVRSGGGGHRQARCRNIPSDNGFLEFARPIIRDGLDKLRGEGRRARSWPCPACCSPPAMSRTTSPRCSTPTRRSIGSCRSTTAATSPSTEGCCASPASGSRRPSALPRRQVPRAETLLMVVGRGTSDPDANSNITKVARMLWEGMGFGWARGLLQRRHLPAGRAGPRACGEAGLPAHHRVPLFPVHRRAGEAHLSHHRRDGGAASGDRVPEGRLSQRSSRWCSTPSPSGCRRSWSARTR